MVQKLSSHRTDIRLGVIAALSNAGVPPFPTMAEEKIFDSKQTPIIHAKGQSILPAVTVYTDGTARKPISHGEPPFMNELDIIVEITMGGVGHSIETDAELEEKLDCFEEQIINALFHPTDDNARNLRQMYKRVISIKSLRLANADNASRLAMRDLVITVDYDDSCQTLDQVFPEFRTLWMCMKEATTNTVMNQSQDDTCKTVSKP